MIRRVTIGILSGLAAMAVLAGLVFASDEKPAADNDKKPLSESERLVQGKDLIDSVCFWCHEPELIETKHLNKRLWASLIRGMIYEGAPVTEDEFQMIVEYLAKNYGPESGEGTGEQK